MNTPRLSVIMPVYNARRYLSESVESILNQTFGDFEFIIVNDGSTDGSLEVLESFADRDSRILLITRPNGGYASALNEALGLAKGEFVARMDADDVSLPKRFEQQVKYLQEHPDCVVVGGSALLIDQEGDSISVSHLPCDHNTMDTHHINGHRIQLFHPLVTMRREALVSIKGYRIDFEPAEDLDLFLRMAEMGKLANLDQVLLKYRHHDTNISLIRAQEQSRKSGLAVSEARQRRGLAPLFKEDQVSSSAEVSGLDVRKNYVRWAIEAGFHRTARKHAWRVWRRHPFAISSWSLLFRSLTRMKAETAMRFSRRARMG